jgi:hypothetical protein
VNAFLSSASPPFAATPFYFSSGIISTEFDQNTLRHPFKTGTIPLILMRNDQKLELKFACNQKLFIFVLVFFLQLLNNLKKSGNRGYFIKKL